MPNQEYAEAYDWLKTVEVFTAEDREKKGKILEAVTAYHTYTEQLRQKDGFGRIPYVTAAQKKRLLELHKAIVDSTEAVLKDDGLPEKIDEGNRFFKGAARCISRVASENFTMITGFDPSVENKTLETLEEEARGMTLDAGDLARGPKSQGSPIKDRQMIAYTDLDGNVVTGLFTRQRSPNAWKGVQDQIKNITKTMVRGPGKELVLGLLDHYVAKVTGGRKSAGSWTLTEEERNTALARLFNDIKEPDGRGYRVSGTKLALAIGKMQDTVLTDRVLTAKTLNTVGSEYVRRLAEGLQPHCDHFMHYVMEAQIPDNSTLGSRGGAMSAVADLLGVPKVLARARPLTFKGAGREEVKGVFMERAKGMDPENLSAEAEQVSEESMKNTDGKAMKDLADLQVLDFICGNVSRDQSNMFYQFDGNHKLTGVQGVNTDCAFGLFVPKDGSNHKHLVGTDNMRCVSASVFKRVMSLDGPTLKYALRGYGLSSKELNAAAKRLEFLKQELEKGAKHFAAEDAKQVRGQGKAGGDLPQNAQKPYAFEQNYIRVIPDEDFHRVRMEDVRISKDSKGRELEWKPNRRAGNAFAHAYGAVAAMGSEYQKNKNTVRNLEEQVTTVGAKNRCLKQNLEANTMLLEGFVGELDRRTRFGHSSGRYRDMHKAARELAKFQRGLYTRVSLASDPKLKDRADYKDDLAAIVRPEDLKKLRELSQKLERASRKYLVGKGVAPEFPGEAPKATKDQYKEYTRKRIDLADSLLDLALTSAEIKPEEKEMAETNERRAMENLSRRQGDLAEQKQRGGKPGEKAEQGPQGEQGKNEIVRK